MFHECVVVRYWIDIEPDMEFRGFVYNNTLNALSQYSTLVYFPRLAALRPELLARIVPFFNERVSGESFAVVSVFVTF